MSDYVTESLAIRLQATKEYSPRLQTAAMLQKAQEHLQSVPYRVTARWLFYRLIHDNVFAHLRGKRAHQTDAKQKAYNNEFKPKLSQARKAFYGGWRPWSLADESRRVIKGFSGIHSTAEDFLEDAQSSYESAQEDARDQSCSLDRWLFQDYYIEIWYEADAMHSQFAHFTRDYPITLRPFRGDPSIEYKWRAAKAIEEAALKYDLPIVILYFGDLDPKGLQIPESALNDIKLWCDAEFELVRAGLNLGHPEHYNIPEQIDKPGAYQWEGLDHEGARDLIAGALGQYWNEEGDAKRREEELRAGQLFGDWLEEN